MTKYLSSSFRVMRIQMQVIPFLFHESQKHSSWCRGIVTAARSLPPHTPCPSCCHPSTSANDSFAIQLLEIHNAKLRGSYLLLSDGLLTQTGLTLHADRIYQQLHSFIKRDTVANFATKVIRPEFLTCGHEIPFRWHTSKKKKPNKPKNPWRAG